MRFAENELPLDVTAAFSGGVTCMRAVLDWAMRRFLTPVVTGVLAVPLMLTAVSPAQATYPGNNGAILLGQSLIGPQGEQRSHSLGPLTSASFAPDGSRFVFPVTVQNDATRIYSSPDGKQLELIGEVTSARVDDLAFAPDGHKIALSLSGGGQGSRIVVVDPTGGHEEVVHTQGADIGAISWDPTGNRIAFAHNGDVRAVDATTHAVATLWESCPSGCDMNSRNASHPNWAPNGQQIAVDLTDGFDCDCSLDDGFDEAVAVLDLTTGSMDVLYDQGQPLGVNPATPLFSPDGTWLAMQIDPSDGRYGTYLMPADGTAPPTFAGDAELLDWQACPTDACPVFGDLFAPTELTLTSKVGTSVRLKATIQPAPGRVRVSIHTWARIGGRWRAFQLDGGRTGSTGTFTTTLDKHRRATRCKAEARFEGNDSFGRSSDVATYRC